MSTTEENNDKVNTPPNEPVAGGSGVSVDQKVKFDTDQYVDDLKDKLQRQKQEKLQQEQEGAGGNFFGGLQTSTPLKKQIYPNKAEQAEKYKELMQYVQKTFDPDMKEFMAKNLTRSSKTETRRPTDENVFTATTNYSQNEDKHSAKSIAAFLSMINSFCSEEKTYLASDYFDSIERVANLHNLDDSVKLSLAKFRLKGRALFFCRKGKLLDITSYDKFKDEILARFQPMASDDEARFRLLNSIQMENETVSQFENRLYLDCQDSIPSNLSPEKHEQIKQLMEFQAVKIFISGLKTEIAQFVRTKDVSTLAEASYYAKMEEKALESRRRKLALLNTNYLPDVDKHTPANPPTAQINMAHMPPLEQLFSSSLGNQNNPSANKFVHVAQNQKPSDYIETRECNFFLPPHRCACHLKTNSTSIPGIFETRLCKFECKIHYDRQIQRPNQNRNFNPNQNNIQRNNNYNRNLASGFQGNQRNQNAPTCYRCGEPGHYSNSCKFITSVCENCNKIGHTSKACRQPRLNPPVANENGQKLDKITAMLTKIKTQSSCNVISTSDSQKSTEQQPKN